MNRSENIINKYEEHGIGYPYMTLNIRSMPCTTTGEILDQYYEGESVIYDYVVITNKYVWISWLSSRGSRRVYMAVKDQVTGERLALCDDIPIGSGGNQGAEIIANEYAEDGICYPNRTINIRSIPCATTGVILDQYYEGENVIYDYVIITNKYTWISWISGGGKRVYMAIKDQVTGERFALCTDVPGSGSGGSGDAERRVKEYSEAGICYPHMTLNIRSMPCATTGEILDQYYEGESVIYDYVVITDRYVWISWTSGGSGKRVYMAVKEQSSGERFALCTDIPGSGSGGSVGGAPMPGVRKVFIDPGHGGSDPGALGNGLRESAVVLDIAKKLGGLLVSKGIMVKYSRESDKYVDLAERSRQANEWGADLFISVHTNAFDGNAFGTECYTHPGDSLEAKQLSANVANTISSELGIYNRGHKEADFAVLRLSNMPAILVETAFIDNNTEANLLKEKSMNFAKAIYKAITGSAIDGGNIELDYSKLFKGGYLQSIIDNSWIFNNMALAFTSDDFSAKSKPILTSLNPMISISGEVSGVARIGSGDYTLTYDGSSTLAANVMSKYIGSDVDINFSQKDLKDVFKVAGVAIPVGESFKVTTKVTGINRVEIIAEHQVNTSFLPEEFKHFPLYARIKIDIYKMGRLRNLYVPAYSSQEIVVADPEAGVDWGNLAESGALVVQGLVVCATLAAAVIMIGGAMPAVGAGSTITAGLAGLTRIFAMVPAR
ncbi:MAG: N-acetylmuramoyl-L-alanine amidase [Aeromonas sp.]